MDQGGVSNAAQWVMGQGHWPVRLPPAAGGCFSHIQWRGFLPQAAAGAFSLARSTVHISFANGTGRSLCHLQWRAFCRRQRQVLSRWREARCIFRSPMAQAGAFATCSGGLFAAGSGRCFLAGANHGASFVRQWHRQEPLPLAVAGFLPQAAAGAFSLARSTVHISFANGTGRCLCRAAATEQRAPGRALCTPRPCASPTRRCAVPSLPQPS